MAELSAVLAGGACSMLGALVLLSLAWRFISGLMSRLCSAAAPAAEELCQPDDDAAPLLGEKGARTCRRYAFSCLQGENRVGRVFRPILLALIATSVGCCVLSTRLETTDLQRNIMGWVEHVAAVIFSFEFLLRLWVCPEGMPNPSGCCVRLTWLLTDICALFDLASLVPFYLELWTGGSVSVDLQLLRALRAMQLLEDAGAGVGTFAKVIASKKEVLLASSFFGATVWLVCSTLYYYFDRGNPDMLLCPLCPDPGDPDSCKTKEDAESCYGRMDSIPSAMFFCIVNLFGEFPLMMEHSVGGRCVGVFIQFFGTAMAGIAMGVIGNGFADYVKEQKGEQEGEDGEDEEGGSCCPYAALPADPEQQQPTGGDLLSALNKPNGYWATLCSGLAVISWVEALIVGHAMASGGEFSSLGSLSGSLSVDELSAYAMAAHEPFEAACVVLFGAEYAMRLAFERRAWGPCSEYASSAMGLVDLLTFAPTLALHFVPVAWGKWLRPLTCFARTLKLERYIGAFGALGRVITEAAPILTTTGVAAAVLLLFFSTLMWIAEFSNPLEEMRGYYESIPRAMWITLLNLSGECPLGDYTIMGKVCVGVIGVFATSIFSVPLGLMSDGFQDRLDDGEEEVAAKPSIGDEGGQTDEELREQLHEHLVAASRILRPGPAAVADVIIGSNNPDCGTVGWLFEKVSVLTIFGSVALVLWESTTGFDARQAENVPLWLQAAELGVIIWFTIEFILRFYAAPADPQYLSRRRYLLSMCGIIDMVSIFPYYLSRIAGHDSILGELGTVADRHDEEFRLCRLLRLLILGNYVPGLGLIMRVFANPRIQRELLVALYVAVTCWLFFATLLHLTESHDGQHPDMAWRFRSVLSAMPFTLIHLTGDYPLVDYTVLARMVHVVMMVTAQGLVGVAGGIVASGFSSELEGSRKEERLRRQNAARTLCRAARHWIFYRKWKSVYDMMMERESKEATGGTKKLAPSLMRLVLKLLRSRVVIFVRIVMIISTIASVMASSVHEIRSAAGRELFDRVEQACIMFFSLDYLLKLYSAPVAKDYHFRRKCYAMGFFGIVDLLTLLPYWLYFGLQSQGIEVDFMLVRILQTLRILQLEEYVRAFTLLDKAWDNCKDILLTSALIAFMIWLFGAVLFFEFERGNEALEGALDSIPSAMHFTAIFLGGEWAVVDFTPMGKVLCMVYCLLGIAVFTIPVGSFFEAFEAAISGDDEE